jgi:hypothetical protein
VLLSSGETALKESGDLQKLVHDSDGKPLALRIRREGKEITVNITPERRQGLQTIVIGEGGEGGEADKVGEQRMQLQLRQLAGQLRTQAQAQAQAPQRPAVSGWQILNAQRGNTTLEMPNDLEVTIKKKGNNPVRIKVRQGAQTWSVKENELDKLPEPIRGHVARMLPTRAATTWLMPGASPLPGAPLNPAPRRNPAPASPAQAYPPRLNPAPANPGAAIPQSTAPRAGTTIGAPGQPRTGAPAIRLMTRENSSEVHQDIEQLKRQLHELREQVEALRKKQ